MTINDRPLADATIAITKAGIAITAAVQEWKVADGLVTIKEAALTLLVGKDGQAPTAPPRSDDEPPTKRLKPEPKPPSRKEGWGGGLEVSGRVVINQEAVEKGRKPIDIQVTFAAGKQNKEWFWVLCGHMTSDISLSSFVSAIDEGSDLDFRLRGVSLIASNANDPACSLTTNGYAFRKGTVSGPYYCNGDGQLTCI